MFISNFYAHHRIVAFTALHQSYFCLQGNFEFFKNILHILNRLLINKLFRNIRKLFITYFPNMDNVMMI
jgi:hypothetical protein